MSESITHLHSSNFFFFWIFPKIFQLVVRFYGQLICHHRYKVVTYNCIIIFFNSNHKKKRYFSNCFFVHFPFSTLPAYTHCLLFAVFYTHTVSAINAANSAYSGLTYPAIRKFQLS